MMVTSKPNNNEGSLLNNEKTEKEDNNGVTAKAEKEQNKSNKNNEARSQDFTLDLVRAELKVRLPFPMHFERLHEIIKTIAVASLSNGIFTCGCI